MGSQKYYTTSDVAKICNVHRNTIIGSIRKGLLKIYRTPGGHARIAEADMIAFCKERNLPVKLSSTRNDKIMIVDDDPLLCRVLKAGFEKQGYRVKVAENGYDAGFLTLEWKPDIMLLDIMLPDINGDQVAKRVRESSQTRHLPIIGISGHNIQSKIDAILDAGANEFVPKPLEIGDMIERVVKLIGPINTQVPADAEAELVTN